MTAREAGQHLAVGAGALETAGEVVGDLNRTCLVTDAGLTDAGVAAAVEDVLCAAGLEVTRFADVEPNPTLASLDRGAAVAGECDVVVGVGGGSCLDAAKAIALLAGSATTTSGLLDAPLAGGLPVLAIPTTAGTGAETNGFGVFADGATKRYIGHESVRPTWVILDPVLTRGLPALPTAATGMDALVHALESWVSRGATPLSRSYAEQAFRTVQRWLPRAVSDGSDLEARHEMQIAAHGAGRALTLSGLGLVHGIAHAVTGHTGAAHGLALTAVLDRVVATSVRAGAEAYGDLAEAWGLGRDGTAFAPALRRFASDVGALHTLDALGVRADQVESIASGALADPVSRNHPVRFTLNEITSIVEDALAS